MRIYSYLIGLCGIIFLLGSCRAYKSSDVSSKTGVSYNVPYNGGLQINRKVKKSPGPGLIAIEGGIFVMCCSFHEDIAYNHDAPNRCVTEASIYIYIYVVSIT